MNILVLNGSPKGENSNTMRLTRAFLEGADWRDAEIIGVAKAGIKGCLGWNKTPGKCVIQDGMSDILPKLIAAAVVIWSFPLYYFSVPGGLKKLIDRQLPLSLPVMSKGRESGGHPGRYDMSRRRNIVISTCGFWTAEGNYEAVTAMFGHFCGAGSYTSLFCGQGELFRIPEVTSRTDEYLDTMRQAGTEYTRGGILSETLDALSEPLLPRNTFETMADASWGIAVDEGGQEHVETDDSLNFTIQMAALYRPDGVERILEMHYTDIDKTCQILLRKDGSEVITEGFRLYTTRIETPYSVWRAISRGEINGSDALFQRMYKVVGGAAGIIAAALVPLLWPRYRPVVYEQISLPIVAGLSLASLLGIEPRLIVPASYLLFGLLWIIGTFVKTPLSAHYSATGYGEDKALANPLFMRTNRILTVAWGALYLVTPIWTYFRMGTHVVSYIGLINSVGPALMGVFTAWFQRWYPAKWARGGSR